VKVLEKGRDQKAWAKEALCTGHGNGNGGCGAKLLVEATDLYKTFRSCRDETETFTTFTCPICQVETDITVPWNIAKGLQPKPKPGGVER